MFLKFGSVQNLSLVLLICVVAGCGGGAPDAPTLVSAKGTVYYKDEPLMGAVVTFAVEGAPLATGTTNALGEFTITTGGRPGCPLGDAKVGITKMTEYSVETTTMSPEQMRTMQMESKGGDAGPKSEIPEKYGNPAGSGLVATLASDGDQNVFEFRLVD